AGGGIDLVVGRRERSRGELRLLLAVPGFNRDRLARLHALEHGRDAVLRHGEDHGYRLQLRDDDQAVGIARTHDVAGIDEPQSHATSCVRAMPTAWSSS